MNVTPPSEPARDPSEEERAHAEARSDRRRAEEFQRHLAGRERERTELRQEHTQAGRWPRPGSRTALPGLITRNSAAPHLSPPSTPATEPAPGCSPFNCSPGEQSTVRGRAPQSDDPTPREARPTNSDPPKNNRNTDRDEHALTEPQPQRQPPKRVQEPLPQTIQSLPTLFLGVTAHKDLSASAGGADSSLLERVLLFATLGHDGAGQPRFTLGVQLGTTRVRLELTALGQHRIALTALLGGTDPQARAELERLFCRLRERGVSIARVVWEHRHVT